MQDVLYLALLIGFFASSMALVRAFARLLRGGKP